MKGSRRALLISCFLVVNILLVVGIVFVCSATLTTSLEKEVNSLASLDFYKDRFNTEIKSDGNYGKVEEAIKMYLDDYALRVQNILNNIDYEKLDGFTSKEYLKSSIFENDLLYLENLKKEFNVGIDVLINENDDVIYNNVYNYIDNFYFVKLYNKVVDEKIIKVINDNRNDLNFKKSMINYYIDSIYNYINFLKQNTNNYIVTGGNIWFNNNELKVEYFNLLEKIKESKI